MDHQLTLHELQRLEAERKLRTIPAELLDVAWVREAQIEAVIDAVLAVTVGGDAAALAEARHVGEWCARIAASLAYGPEPSFARRVGALADVDPIALERIPELRNVAPHVADYQRLSMVAADGEPRVLSLIVAVASEFDARISEGQRSAASVLRTMLGEAAPAHRAIVQALADAIASRKSATAVA